MKTSQEDDFLQEPRRPPMKATDWCILLILGSVLLFFIFYPFPPWAIDMLIMTAIGISFLLFVIAFLVKDNLFFSAFPMLALLFTYFRMVLCIASLRIILWTGMAGHSPGVVISSFSGILSGAGLVQGLVVLALLFMIELFVIARVRDKLSLVEEYYFPPISGSPSKINPVELSEEEKKKKELYYHEANFMSALCGTARVMALDAWFTVFLTALAIPLGFAIGKAHGLLPDEALLRVVCFCAGNGQLTLYSALLLALACAILLTRDPCYWTATGGRPGRASFLLYGLAILFTVTGGIMLLIEGPFPWSACITVAGAIVLSARLHPLKPLMTFNDIRGIFALFGRKKSITDQEPLPLLSLQLGDEHKTWFHRDIFLECLEPFARDLENDLGYAIPPVTFTEGIFRAGQYIISVTDSRKELTRELWEVIPGKLLAVGPEEALERIEGTRAYEPIYCLPALWIDESTSEKAESESCTVLEPHAVIARHVAGLIRKSFHWLLTPREVETRVKALEKRAKVSFSPFIPKRLSYKDLHRILRDLLREGFPIGNLMIILEMMKKHTLRDQSGQELNEVARVGLAKMYCIGKIEREGSLKVLTLSKELEKKLLLASTDFAGEMSKELFQAISMEIKNLFLHCLASGIHPPMVVSPPIRSLVRTITVPPLTPPLRFCIVNPMRLTIAAKLANPSCPDLIIISSSDVPQDSPLSVIADLDFQTPF